MNIATTSLNAGEMTPRIDTRVDLSKYSSGCRHLENMLVTIYGGVEKRPGTTFVAIAEIPVT